MSVGTREGGHARVTRREGFSISCSNLIHEVDRAAHLHSDRYKPSDPFIPSLIYPISPVCYVSQKLRIGIWFVGAPMASVARCARLRGFTLVQSPTLRAVLPRRCSVCISSLETPQQPEPVVSVRRLSPPSPPKQKENSWEDHPDYRRWKDKEGEILLDIEPIKFRIKDILHSDRYRDGERLSTEDEKVVVEKLLAYHPHAEDKIGCGLDSIMVDRHPQFINSRCLFVVRTDGVWIDFSYQKCLRAYIKEKYPSHSERFIKEHFKRT